MVLSQYLIPNFGAVLRIDLQITAIWLDTVMRLMVIWMTYHTICSNVFILKQNGAIIEAV